MAVFTPDFHLIFHSWVKMAVAHGVLSRVAINASHFLFRMDIGNQFPHESTIYFVVVQGSVYVGSAVLRTLHFTMIIQSDPGTPIMAGFTSFIRNFVR
jgi:hypothetical protein